MGELQEKATLFSKISTADKGDDKSAANNNDAQAKVATELSEFIIKQYDMLDNKIRESEYYKTKVKHDVKDWKTMTMQDAYQYLLAKQRFAYCCMKGADGTYTHHWNSHFKGKFSPSSTKMIRLAQEIADLSTSLPVDSSNAMFVRADDERIDVMKVLIFGAEGTPYGNGGFEYHVYFDHDYPNSPPKVNLETTGNGDVRFNPNLYSCGKVCLSLLGTWRGNASENWDSKISN